jgi:hypothetical protein
MITNTENTRVLAVRPLPHGMHEVVDRLTGEVHQVKVNRGRHIGPCSCRGDRRPPWEKCHHQLAVRDYLMGLRFSSRLRSRPRPTS